MVITLTPPAAPLLQAEPPLGRLVNALIVLALLTLIALCFTGFMLLLAALLPRVVRRSKQALERSPWRAFFIGLANYLFLGGISLVLLNIEPLAWLGLLIAAGLLGVTGLGMSGLASLVGERLARLSGGQTQLPPLEGGTEGGISPLKQLIWGSVVLELASLLPLLGWFLLAPILLMVSFGAAILAWRNRGNEGMDEFSTMGNE
jgi:hypothetical protein